MHVPAAAADAVALHLSAQQETCSRRGGSGWSLRYSLHRRHLVSFVGAAFDTFNPALILITVENVELSFGGV